MEEVKEKGKNNKKNILMTLLICLLIIIITMVLIGFCINLRDEKNKSKMEDNNVATQSDNASSSNSGIYTPTDNEEDDETEIYYETGITKPKPIYCHYDGELKQGAEFIHGQYTYRYMQEGTSIDEDTSGWYNMNDDGWGVMVTKVKSEEKIEITSEICSYINDKPVVSTSYMFYGSYAKLIDVSSFDTSNVVDMSGMFASIYSGDYPLKIIGLSVFDTSKVTDMSHMFSRGSFVLDLSSFDLSNVKDRTAMFWDTVITKGYAKTQEDADRLNYYYWATTGTGDFRADYVYGDPGYDVNLDYIVDVNLHPVFEVKPLIN